MTGHYVALRRGQLGGLGAVGRLRRPLLIGPSFCWLRTQLVGGRSQWRPSSYTVSKRPQNSAWKVGQKSGRWVERRNVANDSARTAWALGFNPQSD